MAENQEITVNNVVDRVDTLGSGKAQVDLLNLTFGVGEVDEETGDVAVVQYLMPNVNAISLDVPQESYKVRGDNRVVETLTKGPSEATGSLSLTALTDLFNRVILGHNVDENTGGVGPGSNSLAPEVSATVDKRSGDGTLTVEGYVAIKCHTPSKNMDRSGEGITHDNVAVPFEARSVKALGSEFIYLERTGLSDEEAAKFRAYIHNFRFAEAAELDGIQRAAALANVKP